MNSRIFGSIQRSRRNNEIRFLESKLETMKADEKAREEERKANAVMSELFGYEDEMVSDR